MRTSSVFAVSAFHLARKMALTFSSLSSKSRWLAAGALCSLLVLTAPTLAQGEAGPRPTGLIAPRADAANSRFFWCAGVADQGDLAAYVAAGFDTLVIPLPWRAGEDGTIFDTSFGPQRALANEGAKRGLQILFSLPASPEGLGVSRVSADSPSYAALWTNWAQNALTALSDTPNLAGWMLPDDSRSIATFDDAGFRRYLAGRFASIEALNARWGMGYADFDSVSLSDVDALVQRWKERATSNGKKLLPSLRNLPTPPDPSAAFAPSALSLADFKAGAWKDLMSLWAGTVRGADSRRIVFSGTCPDYAQLLAMPEGVDVSVAGVAPSVAEPDIVTHNPQAVDIARRGGTRQCIAQFSIAPRADMNATTIAQLLPRWVESALAHGARGVAFDSFEALERNPALNDAVSKTLARAKTEALDFEAPGCTTAVLLEPLAEGAVVHLGQNGESRGLYGFGEGLVAGEPTTLVASLRWGTAFGGVDFLTPDDLGSTDLSRYGTILAPQLLDCSPNTAQKLGDWMRAGGTFVSDLGLGALQNGGSASALPPQMALLAGGIGPFELRQSGFNLRGGVRHPLLPTWAKLLGDRPGMIVSHGDADDDVAFDGPAGFAPFSPTSSAVPVATGPSVAGAAEGYNTAPIAGGADANRKGVMLSIAPVERGFFVFAPFRLWASWRPGQFGFDPLHGDILARGADLAVATDAFTPFPAGARLGLTRFPEIINRPSSITFLNHDAGGVQNVALDTSGTGDWLWSNALVRMLPPSATLFNGSRPAPIGAADELETRPRALSLFAIAPSSQKLVCRVRPISVQNLNGGTITAQITEETSGKLGLKVWGPTLQISATMGGVGWQPIAPDGTTSFRVSVVDSRDGYRCPPGSRHRVLVTDFGIPAPDDKGRRKKNANPLQLVVADASGRLKVEFSGAACQVEVEPDIGPVGIGKKPRAR